MPNQEMSEFLKGVAGVVEANSYEILCLWREHQERKGTWTQRNDGLGETVGHVDDMPVHISLTTAEIDGQKILFIEATSAMVDHRMVTTWLEENLPTSAFRNGDPRQGVNKTDAMNFHIVLPHKSAA